MWEIYKSGSTRGEWVATSCRRPLSYSTETFFRKSFRSPRRGPEFTASLRSESLIRDLRLSPRAL